MRLLRISNFCSRSLPVNCMVTDVSLQDQLLKDEYTDLPPLASVSTPVRVVIQTDTDISTGQLKSWSDRPGPGTTRFSGWQTVCPTLEFT